MVYHLPVCVTRICDPDASSPACGRLVLAKAGKYLTHSKRVALELLEGTSAKPLNLTCWSLSPIAVSKSLGDTQISPAFFSLHSKKYPSQSKRVLLLQFLYFENCTWFPHKYHLDNIVMNNFVHLQNLCTMKFSMSSRPIPDHKKDPR